MPFKTFKIKNLNLLYGFQLFVYWGNFGVTYHNLGPPYCFCCKLLDTNSISNTRKFHLLHRVVFDPPISIVGENSFH